MNCETGVSDRIYIDVYKKTAKKTLAGALRKCLLDTKSQDKEIVIVCIGTDRATGDSLGPLTGYKLSRFIGKYDNLRLYGTLNAPVHANNLQNMLEHIKSRHKNATIVAIDASLGKMQSVGMLSVGIGAIKPGEGVKKTLPPIGDIYITGIVNLSGGMDTFVLQNTRLCVVMKMAEVICGGIRYSMEEIG